MPVVPESFGLRGAVFADAATLYGNDHLMRSARSAARAWNGALRSVPA